jgi:hypothetical protein
MGKRRCTYRALMGKPEEKKPLGRPRRRWENNNKMDLQEVGWGHGLDLSGLEKEQVEGSCERGNDPSGFTKFEEFLD